MKRISTLTAAVTLGALPLTGCDVTDIDGDEPPIPEYTSPATVLTAVQISFNQRNVNYLKASLSPNFVFYFDPDDVGQTPPGGSNYVIPESWSYTVFWQAVGHLLEQAYSISLRIYVGPVNEPGPEQEIFKAENVSIKLLVMVDEVNGFLVDNGYCDFEFERYTGEGGKLWRLTDWWDNTSFPYDVNPSLSPGSLGRIFAMYK